MTIKKKDVISDSDIMALYEWIADRRTYIEESVETHELPAFEEELQRLSDIQFALNELEDYRNGTDAVYFTVRGQRWKHTDSEFLDKVINHALLKLGVR